MTQLNTEQTTLLVALGERSFTPTTVADVLQTANARYGRELLGLLTYLGYAQVDETPDGDVWNITPAGKDYLAVQLDTGRGDVVELDQTSETTGQAPQPKEHEMATATQKSDKNKNTTKPAAKTAKTEKAAKVIEFRKCGCNCGQDVSGKTQFKQGHDARMISQIVAAVVGSNAGSRTGKQAEALLPVAFTKQQEKDATGSADIQHRIDLTAAAVESHYGAKLGAKSHNAMMNGWQRESDRANRAQATADRKAAKDAAKADKAKAKEVTAKVGRWTKTGVVKNGKLHTQDSKGNPQVIEKGKFEVIETATEKAAADAATDDA